MKTSHYPSTTTTTPVLQRQLSSSVSSFSVETNKAALVMPPSPLQEQEGQRLYPRRVCFDETENEVYFNHEDLTTEEVEAAWYNANDMSGFRQGIFQDMTQLSQTKGFGPWIRSLRRTHQAFAQANSIDDMITATQNWKLIVSVDTRGLETRFLNKRRQALLDEIEFLSSLESDRVEEIRQVCRLDSRADRLLAFYLARLAAGKEYQTPRVN